MTAPNPFIEHPAEHEMCYGGDHWTFKFANGYGASVVNHSMCYGGDRGLNEVAVLGLDGHLTYSTPVTEDVIGYLTVDGVRDVLRQIAELPALAEVAS